MGAESRDHGAADTKKRKRNRKAPPDRKFDCQHEGCGKSYSRAEHLHRHQLNHTPKQIYRCDFPDCYRTFVRQDLCIRHRERHTTHGSQLQKRDNFAQASGNLRAGPSPPPGPTQDENTSATKASPKIRTSTSTQTGIHAAEFTSTDVSYPPLTPQTGFASGDPGIRRSDSASSYVMSPSKAQTAMYTTGSYGPVSASTYQNTPFSPSDLRRSPSTTNAGTAYMSSGGLATSPPLGSTTYMSQQDLSMSNLGFSNSNLSQSGHYGPAGLSAMENSGMVSGSAENGVGVDSSYPYPIFGGETYNRSPFAMGDDFAAWLFNEPTTGSPVNYSNMMAGYSDPSQTHAQFAGNDPAYGSAYPNVIPQHPMSVTSILDSTPPEAMMSEEKRQDVLHLISTRFNETAHSAVNTRKEALMEGDIDADSHILSLRMMQTYVGSYWLHFHAQLPILHKPTFVADRTPTLLLLSLMAIGAATLEKAHGQLVTEAAADLANFLAWHIRWEIFMDVDFRPPAKLWVFQTLLLLEVYEKSYSTRALHERAHIHHDTTLTLMRRGSSFLGRSALDSPASYREGNQSSTATSETGVRDDSWSQWIRTEATRRVAFGAFVMDSIHGTMFGHSVKMVAHELRLPLPCDEALWSATSAAEVSRMQTVLQSNGVKPVMFLDGLKKTLTGQKVRTNGFGRTILMAGLLSVSWHMNQRDLQVSSLGVAQALGGRDKWRASLLRAFDNWKRDFDETLADSGYRGGYRSFFQPQYHEDDTFESRTVLHHLAHMVSHVDIVDCQVFGGASRLLGRSITPRDYSTAREKMTERWATKASARDATFYALKFLCQVLLPSHISRVGPNGKSMVKPAGYSAREDFLLHRPWVVYLAALVVWSYGYALEGAIPSPPELPTAGSQIQDMQRFLQTIGAVREPSDLEHVTGRNQCLGLLMHLQASFRDTRWELLHEAAGLLERCIEKLKTVQSIF
ncbi:putative C2H2 finger domain protein [Talaromyces proteolyticus]|uniref:C2H2 finger domain protein n=1 Tax=Talaromyces proteolyticus TaxID=1131652 RepID=A0AAD4PTX0_9EURO|nr:putative C2H2 finger domain protein [Talaromyces proteolyticus]KAH8691490.1 putative C2H2 finger domain protein [Talaromyces proteolyticus]